MARTRFKRHKVLIYCHRAFSPNDRKVAAKNAAAYDDNDRIRRDNGYRRFSDRSIRDPAAHAFNSSLANITRRYPRRPPIFPILTNRHRRRCTTPPATQVAKLRSLPLPLKPRKPSLPGEKLLHRGLLDCALLGYQAVEGFDQGVRIGQGGGDSGLLCVTPWYRNLLIQNISPRQSGNKATCRVHKDRSVLKKRIEKKTSIPTNYAHCH